MRKETFIKSALLSLILTLVFTLPVLAKDLPPQQNVSLEKEWKITFNQPVGTNTFNRITLYRTDTAPESKVNIAFGVNANDKNSVLIKHDTPFISGASYRLTIDDGAISQSGDKIAEPINFNFQTQALNSDESKQIKDMRSLKIVVPAGSIITLDGRILNLIIELQIHKLRIEPESTFGSMVKDTMFTEDANAMLTLDARSFNAIVNQVLNGTIDDDAAILQLQSIRTINSSIDGDFNGWSGSTIFKLQNGQIWKQSSYAYIYHYAYNPKVTISKSGLVYKMKVDGVDGEINVTRLK